MANDESLMNERKSTAENRSVDGNDTDFGRNCVISLESKEQALEARRPRLVLLECRLVRVSCFVQEDLLCYPKVGSSGEFAVLLRQGLVVGDDFKDVIGVLRASS